MNIFIKNSLLKISYWQLVQKKKKKKKKYILKYSYFKYQTL